MSAESNLVIIMSDEHNRAIVGAYHHPFVRTPHIDGLAREGTVFANAYCNSPICVPSRASFATGRYVHRTGHWDNAFPYSGEPPAWHHAARAAGCETVSVGKLHFRGAAGDDNGFSEEIVPLHVVGGVGDLKALLRAPPAPKKGTDALAREAGRGESEYTRYDGAIAQRACQWLRARRDASRPFVLFVSFVMPHFPLVAPPQAYDLYAGLDLDTLRTGLSAPPPDHPVLAEIRRYMSYDDHFDDERRATALRAYFGMVSAVDGHVGAILAALREAGLGETTRVIYTSDHGDNLGNRGMWGKSVMYEDSVAVPLVLSGPGVPQGRTCKTPVSLVDVCPTVLQTVGAAVPPDLQGRSLLSLAAEADEPERAVFAEYHAAGSPTGLFMLRKGRHKLVEYVGAPPQLFDLTADPREIRDLAADPAHAGTLESLRAALAAVCDIEAVNARAFADQAARVKAHGGREAILRTADIAHTPAPV